MVKKRDNRDRNDAEKGWHERVRELGCWLHSTEECGGGLQLHHVLYGGRRISQYHVLPLCKWHHHWDSPLPSGDCLGKGSKPWEEKHGKQTEMLAELFNKLGDPRVEEQEDENW